ncbi:MAG: hypothetical protein OEU32_01475 [Acidimicrobiia bacterium]|nr:hypothetical protein [Acidimicrobiia bacterium]
MCVAAAPARFSHTIVYAGEARRDGSIVHVLGYENTAQNRIGPRRWFAPWRSSTVGNAMLLHFPATPGSMSQANAVDTESCPHILSDMVRALFPPVASVNFAQALPVDATAEVFDSGIYTVVLASDASAIPDALQRVPGAKRPAANDELFAWYSRHFAGWPVALCCFDNRDAHHATPMLWWYEPRFPELLFAPAIDAHTGGLPDLDASVDVDHRVVLGTIDGDGGMPVRYSDPLDDDVGSLLPERVVGADFAGSRLPNGDFVTAVESIRRGSPRIERRVLGVA